jgi:hypothetical protein
MADPGNAADENDFDAETYPAWADDDEQRRAYVLDCVGQAASEMDAQALGQMIVDLAEVLRTGVAPAKGRRLRPVV